MITKDYRPRTSADAKSTQYAVIRKLIEDNNFFINISQILDESDFTGIAQTVVSNIKEYFKEHSRLPQWKELYSLAEDKHYEENKRFDYETFIKEAHDTEVSEAEVNVNLYVERAKRDALERFASKLKEYSRSKEYSPQEAISMLTEGMNKIQVYNKDENLPLSEKLKKLETSHLSYIPTGLKMLDEHCNGGVIRGCVGVIVAGTGVGKTSLGTIMSVGIAKQNVRCLYCWCEGAEEDQLRKILSALSGEYSNKLAGEHAKKVLNELTTENSDLMKTLDDNLITYEMLNGYTTIEDIITEVNMLKIKGRKPDVVFIDYISCLRVAGSAKQRADKEYQLFELLMRRIELWAKQEQIFVWVLAQTNRNGLNKEAENGCADIEGSKRILNPSSFNLFLKKEADDMFKLRLEKCRNASLINWDITMNNGTCQLEMRNENEVNENYLKEIFGNNKFELHDKT